MNRFDALFPVEETPVNRFDELFPVEGEPANRFDALFPGEDEPEQQQPEPTNTTGLSFEEATGVENVADNVRNIPVYQAGNDTEVPRVQTGNPNFTPGIGTTEAGELAKEGNFNPEEGFSAPRVDTPSGDRLTGNPFMENMIDPEEGFTENNLIRSRATIQTKKDYVLSGQKATDKAEMNLLQAFGQGMHSTLKNMERGVNKFIQTIDPGPGLEFGSRQPFVGGPEAKQKYFEKRDDDLAATIEKMGADSNFKMSDPRFWSKAVGGVVPQVAGAMAFGIPGAIVSSGLSQGGEGLATYDKVFKESGDENAAAQAGMITTMFNTALDAVGISKVLSPGSFIKRIRNGFAAEGATEGTQQVVRDVTEDIKIAQGNGLSPEEVMNTIRQKIPEYAQNAGTSAFVGGVLGSGISGVTGSKGHKPEPTTEAKVSDAEIDGLDNRPGVVETRSRLDKVLDKVWNNPLTWVQDSSAGEAVGKLFTPISTVLGKVDARIPKRLQRMEVDKDRSIRSQTGIFKRFKELYKTMTIEEQAAVDAAIANNDMDALSQVGSELSSNNDSDTVYSLAFTLSKNKENLSSVNRNSGTPMAPLMVADAKGFKKINAVVGSKLDPKATAKDNADILTMASEILINEPDSAAAKVIKENTISPLESVGKQMIDDVGSFEMGKLLGEDGGNSHTDISKIITELQEAGTITPEQLARVNRILGSYSTRKSTHGAVKHLKNLTLIDTLGSTFNAMSQLGDVGSSAYYNGIADSAIELGSAIKNTFTSEYTNPDTALQEKKNTSDTVKAWRGKQSPGKPERLTQSDVGIQEGKLDQEISDSGGTDGWVSKIFKMSGFTSADKIGKETILNSTVRSMKKRVNSDTKKLFDELSPLFDTVEKTRSVMKEFRDSDPKDYSDDANFVLYSKLLDVQPISHSEMPESYLTAGNGRLFYTLKTFALKRIDLIRRESLGKIATGTAAEKATGLKNLSKLAIIFGVTEAGVDELRNFIKTGSFKDESFSSTIVDNYLQMAFLSKHALNSSDPIKETLTGIIPPTKFVSAFFHDAKRLYNSSSYNVVDGRPVENKLDGGFNPIEAKMMKSVPLVGEVVSAYAGHDKAKRDNKSSFPQSEFAEAKRLAKKKAEKTGSSKDAKSYRYLTKQSGQVSKLSRKINKLKEMERRSGKRQTQKIEKLSTQRDRRINLILQKHRERY